MITFCIVSQQVSQVSEAKVLREVNNIIIETKIWRSPSIQHNAKSDIAIITNQSVWL